MEVLVELNPSAAAAGKYSLVEAFCTFSFSCWPANQCYQKFFLRDSISFG